jgi:hypothetical protein
MADNQKITRIVLRHDTSENWVNLNPVLLRGELAIELTEDGSVKMKVGNGSSKWNDLAHISAESTGTTTPEGGASSAEVEKLKSRVAVVEAELKNHANKFDSIDALLESNAASFAAIQEDLLELAAKDNTFAAAMEALQI